MNGVQANREIHQLRERETNTNGAKARAKASWLFQFEKSIGTAETSTNLTTPTLIPVLLGLAHLLFELLPIYSEALQHLN